MRRPRTRRVQLAFAEAQQVLALEPDLAAARWRAAWAGCRGWRGSSVDLPQPDSPTTPRMRPRCKLELDVVEDLRHALVGAHRQPQVADFESSGIIALAHRERLSRGSTMSRRPSPSRLKPSTVSRMASPGKVEYHQASRQVGAALGDGEAPVRLRRRGAHAEEAQHRRDQDGEAHADGGAHDDRREGVGQDVQEDDAERRRRRCRAAHR